jgi:hypothetical protein
MRDLVSPDLDLIKQAEQEAGWLRYEKGDRTPRLDPEVARIIKERAAEMGVERRSFTERGDPAPSLVRLGQLSYEKLMRG